MYLLFPVCIFINSTAMNILIHVFWYKYVYNSFGHIIAPFSFSRYFQIPFQTDYLNLHSYQLSLTKLFVLHPCCYHSQSFNVCCITGHLLELYCSFNSYLPGG